MHPAAYRDAASGDRSVQSAQPPTAVARRLCGSGGERSAREPGCSREAVRDALDEAERRRRGAERAGQERRQE